MLIASVATSLVAAVPAATPEVTSPFASYFTKLFLVAAVIAPFATTAFTILGVMVCPFAVSDPITLPEPVAAPIVILVSAGKAILFSSIAVIAPLLSTVITGTLVAEP